MIWLFPINPYRYEAYGIKGWMSLQKTIYINETYPAIFTADAKRGDIGNTSSMYAKAFEDLNFDSVTVARTWERFSGALPPFETNILCLP
jgi:hypothetical protein